MAPICWSDRLGGIPVETVLLLQLCWQEDDFTSIWYQKMISFALARSLSGSREIARALHGQQYASIKPAPVLTVMPGCRSC